MSNLFSSPMIDLVLSIMLLGSIFILSNLYGEKIIIAIYQFFHRRFK